MKNVLFATTALVAFAGAAAAGSHGGVSFSGEMEAGYNDVRESGLYWNTDLDVTASVDMGDNVTATLTLQLFAGAQNIDTQDIDPTVEIAYTGDTLSASLKYGDLGDAGASEYFYADRDGMAVDVENQDSDNDFRALVEFGNFGVSAGCANITNGDCNDGMNYGAGATFGSITLGLGYDDAGGTQTAVTAVSADAEFGAATVGVSYAGSTPQDSIGVAVGYTVSEALSVAAYYASNSASSDAFGVSVAYASGALTAGVYYDSAATDSYGVDVSYAVSDAITANAGIFDGGTMVYYAGVDYAVNDNISATVSYATAHEISGPEYMDGISAYITASF